MSRPTVCTVNISTLKNNLQSIKKHVGKKVLALVKADAYGHGIVECSQAFSEAGADYLGVATLEEAIQIRNAGIKTNILCIGAVPYGDEEISAGTELEQTITAVSEIARLEKACKKLNVKKYIHVKIDTGMHRLGVRCGADLDEVLNAIKNSEFLTLKGVFTHFASSDTFDKKYTYYQLEQFKTAVSQIKEHGFKDYIVHCSNSGAILSYPDIDFDMVRAGIILYGYYPSGETEKSVTVEPALSFETRIIAINKIYKGEQISYGGTYTAKKDMLIAVLPVGYGDGYKRLSSNRGYVLVNGKKAMITGRICMDMTMIDITDIAASVGDKVTLIGKQGEEVLTADDIARWCETISYEIPLSITKRVNKIYEE